MNFSYLLKYLLAILISHNLYAADIIVTVENIQNRDGTINIALFTESGGFPNEAAKTQGMTLPVEHPLVKGTFTNLPENNYAIAVYQDENGNNKLDKNFFGIPKEPYGFSGNSAKLGPPSFDEASSSLTRDDIHLVIRLK